MNDKLKFYKIVGDENDVVYRCESLFIQEAEKQGAKISDIPEAKIFSALKFFAEQSKTIMIKWYDGTKQYELALPPIKSEKEVTVVNPVDNSKMQAIWKSLIYEIDTTKLMAELCWENQIFGEAFCFECPVFDLRGCNKHDKRTIVDGCQDRIDITLARSNEKSEDSPVKVIGIRPRRDNKYGREEGIKKL